MSKRITMGDVVLNLPPYFLAILLAIIRDAETSVIIVVSIVFLISVVCMILMFNQMVREDSPSLKDAIKLFVKTRVFSVGYLIGFLIIVYIIGGMFPYYDLAICVKRVFGISSDPTAIVNGPKKEPRSLKELMYQNNINPTDDEMDYSIVIVYPHDNADMSFLASEIKYRLVQDYKLYNNISIQPAEDMKPWNTEGYVKIWYGFSEFDRAINIPPNKKISECVECFEYKLAVDLSTILNFLFSQQCQMYHTYFLEMPSGKPRCSTNKLNIALPDIVFE